MYKKIATILLCFILSSCRKDDQNRIPEVYVDYTIPLVQFAQDNEQELLFVNAGLNTGVAGLIIYRLPNNTFVAYDRCSSVNPSQRCAVIRDDTNLFVVEDPCSGAKFDLFDGSPVKAPAVRPLKQYQVIQTQFNLTVRN